MSVFTAVPLFKIIGKKGNKMSENWEDRYGTIGNSICWTIVNWFDSDLE